MNQMRKQLSLLFLGVLWASSFLMAQVRDVSGKVTDGTNGNPIAGVTVKVKQSDAATATDVDGNFSIRAEKGNTLVFTAVGYGTTEIAVGDGNYYTVTLSPGQSDNLDEVIVVAYGTAEKKSFTGSAATVSAREIKDNSVISFENALLGKLPGVQITSSSGQAGSTPTIRVRGIGSMNASNSPLYVIDGVPAVSGTVGQMGDYIYTSNNVMNSINPNDIESITVLKDAAAASLYGSRAANGVIVITTKKGRVGKPTVNLRSSIGFTPDWAYDNWEPASVQDQINMMYQIYHDYRTSAGWNEDSASVDAINRLNTRFRVHGYYFEVAGTGLYENVAIKGLTDGIENREGKYFNWEDVLFRTGIYQTNDLSISGGTENSRYYTSLSYTKDKNRVVINQYERIAGRINLTQKIGNFLEANTNINISNNVQEGFNDTRNLGANYFMQTRNLLWPIYWPTDYKTGLPFTTRFGSLTYNALYYQNEWDNSSKITRINAAQSLSARLFNDLVLKTIFSYENNLVKDHIYYSANHYNGTSSNGSVSEMVTNYNKLVTSNTANYNKKFGNHGIDLLAGFEAEKNFTDYNRASGTNLPSSAVPTVATAGERDANSYSWGYNLMSFLSRAEYSFANKYNVSASFRRDGTSRLSPKVRWGNFWSVGASWAISEESFMKDVTWINNLRIKASHGINGTVPSSNFGWRNLVSYGSRYMDDAGGGLSTLGNEDLTWETNHTTNIGIDFSMFESRLYGTIELFNRDSRDVLQSVPISRVTGFTSILRNIGEINNKGIEVSLGYDIIRNEDWRWGLSVNLASVKSTVTKLYRGEGEDKGQDIIWSDPTGGDARAGFIYREGESMLSFYGYEWAGVDPANGANVWYVNDPNDPKAGEFLFNGRGATYTFGNANRIILGSAIPKAYGGINSDLQYKGFTLNLNFIYKLGGYLYDGANKDVADDGYYWERIRSQYYFENRWTESNPKGTQPKLRGTDLTDPMQNSSRQMHDATFIRLKSITLGYNLPKAWLEPVHINSARVYFNGANLLTFAKYKVADPEVNHYGTRGWETPFGKTYTFGIELSF